MLIWMHGKKAPSSEADEPKYVCMNSHVVQLGIWVVLAAGNVLSCCRVVVLSWGQAGPGCRACSGFTHRMRCMYIGM